VTARQIAERVEQAERDLLDVDHQELAGELDEETAQHLRATYRAEIATARAALDQLAGDPSAESPPRSRQRVVAGATAIIVAFGVIGFAASRAVSERDGGFITGTGAESPIDLDSISNEEMVAVIEANRGIPEVNAMRLALAERYFEANQYSEALPWFQEVLENNPTSREASEALGRVGWMVYVSGEAEVAEQYFGRALDFDGENLEAELFLSLMLLDQGRTTEAVGHLERVAAGDLPADVRQIVEDALAEARTSG